MLIGPYTYNKIDYDEFGRASGIVGFYKPRGITSHDAVHQFRKEFHTRKVGHAGTLDPFAEGLLIILLGKALPMANQLVGMDKTYEATAIVGIETDSGDIEGEVIHYEPEIMSNSAISQNVEIPSAHQIEQSIHQKIKNVLSEFTPSYRQQVPIFSSVKVNGQKLRVLARESDTFHIYQENGVKKVDFIRNDKVTKTVEIPVREVSIYELQTKGCGLIAAKQILEDPLVSESIKSTLKHQLSKDSYPQSNIQLPTCSFVVSCSKGTYIRQLIIDIGKQAEVPMILVGLQRTRIGNFTL